MDSADIAIDHIRRKDRIPDVKIISMIFWLAIFVAATFLWVVLFEHGPSGFVDGISVEYEKLKTEFGQPVEGRGDISDQLPQ